jgi:hypothetical protein
VKQKYSNEWDGYGNTFKTPHRMIFNSLFILGLNQEQFKDEQLIYGQKILPDYQLLAAALNRRIGCRANERVKERQRQWKDRCKRGKS